jgi:hypothetical protein
MKRPFLFLCIAVAALTVAPWAQANEFGDLRA